MNNTIDDFHELKELLQDNGFRIRDAEFESKSPDHQEFDVALTLFKKSE